MSMPDPENISTMRDLVSDQSSLSNPHPILRIPNFVKFSHYDEK